MELLKSLNLLSAFLLELAMIGAYSYWGFHLHTGTLLRAAVGIGVPIMVIIIWTTLLAPRAAHRLTIPWLTLVKLILFMGAGLLLYNSQEVGLGATLGGLAILNLVLASVWKQT